MTIFYARFECQRMTAYCPELYSLENFIKSLLPKLSRKQ